MGERRAIGKWLAKQFERRAKREINKIIKRKQRENDNDKPRQGNSYIERGVEAKGTHRQSSTNASVKK